MQTQPIKDTYLQEGRTRLSHLFANVLADILAADVGAPLFEDFFLERVDLVERHEDLGDGGNQVRVFQPNESLNTPKQ